MVKNIILEVNRNRIQRLHRRRSPLGIFAKCCYISFFTVINMTHFKKIAARLLLTMIVIISIQPACSLDFKYLVIAIRNGDIEELKILLKEAFHEENISRQSITTADRFSPDPSQELTPDNAVRCSLNHYLCKSVRGPWGDTPPLSLMQLVSGYSSPEFVQLLIDYGLNVDYEPSRHRFYSFSERNNLLMPRCLDADLALHYQHASPPVHLAILRGKFNNLKVLINNGARYKFKGRFHKNLMHLSIEQNLMYIFRYLYSLSPRMICSPSPTINSSGECVQMTPLELSVYLNQTSVIVSLINVGADLSTLNAGNLLSLARDISSSNVFNILGVAMTASNSISDSNHPELTRIVFSLQDWAIFAIAKNFNLDALYGIFPKKLSLKLFGKDKLDE